jgi:Asp-tRNA(Asn)/Glu-tRNA(Gln) amidotransferase A subunit family amidase
MATHFSAAPNLCKQISAGKLSSVEVLSEVIAQIGNFDDTMNAVVVRDLERASKRPGLPA